MVRFSADAVSKSARRSPVHRVTRAKPYTERGAATELMHEISATCEVVCLANSDMKFDEFSDEPRGR